MVDADLSTAVVARLRADATLTALLASGTNSIGSEEMTARTQSGYPYICVFIDATPQSDGFSLDGIDAQFSVHVFSLTTAGLVAPAAIVTRIYGDAISQASRQATYGLHRWKPSSSIGGFTNPTLVVRQDGTTDHEVDHYRFIERYRLDMTRTS